MKTRNIIMAAIVAAIFIVAAVILIVALVTHDEPGFMDDSKQWGGLPLTISCHPYVEDDGSGCGTVRGAVETTNERLGFDAFVWASDDAEAIATVEVGVPVEQGWMDPGGVATLSDDGTRYTRCEVATANTGTLEMLSLTVQHELGHCLGLAHDDFDNSIMRPVQTPTPMGSFPPRIDDHDRALLRETYADD